MARYRGRYRDFLDALQAASRRINERDGVVLPWKPRGWKHLADLPMNLLGVAIAGALEVLPAWFYYAFFSTVYKKLSDEVLAEAPDFWDKVADAKRIAEHLKERAGKRCAIFGTMSHPPTEPEVINLNMELLGLCYRAIREVRGRPTRIRTVAAVDQFALDGLSFPVEGGYAGLMSSSHIGVDRLPHLRGRIQAWLMPHARIQRVVWRVLRNLRRGGDVVMAQSGGVYATGRLLYVLREGLARMRRGAPGAADPAAVVAALERFPRFQKFRQEHVSPEGLEAGPWRLIEAWLLHHVNENLLMVSGRLDPEAEILLRKAAEAVGLDAPGVEGFLESFKEEFGRGVPYRERLYRLFAARIVARGRPLLLLPVDHGDWRKPVGRIRRPAGLLPGSAPGRVRVVEWDGGPRETERDLREFLAPWVRENFPDI